MRLTFKLLLLVLVLTGVSTSSNVDEINEDPVHNITIGSYSWLLERKCPDDEVKFWLFTRTNVNDKQLIHVDDTLENSNLSSSFFDPRHPSKIIIHGYRSDFYLTPLHEMKHEYLQQDNFNIFYVDWYNLSSSFYFPAAVHNVKHVGECVAQLVHRIRDQGSSDIHVIGFSLGGQVPNYISNYLKPDFLLPRITGLDPALPLFAFNDKDHKLDPSDAEFVDVYHTNALIQGQIAKTGDVDFIMNNGVIQPGCSSKGALVPEIIKCSHQRAPEYFLESINSALGFWGWYCQSYFHFLLGLCPHNNNKLVVAGEHCNVRTMGIFLVQTNAESPFAVGKKPRDVLSEETRSDEELKSQLKRFYHPTTLDFSNQLQPEVIMIQNNKNQNPCKMPKTLKLPSSC